MVGCSFEVTDRSQGNSAPGATLGGGCGRGRGDEAVAMARKVSMKGEIEKMV
jgi:hypothetical protein